MEYIHTVSAEIKVDMSIEDQIVGSHRNGPDLSVSLRASRELGVMLVFFLGIGTYHVESG